MNLQNEKGYDIEEACNFIINSKQMKSENESENIFNKQDRRFARALIRAINLHTNNGALANTAFRAHSKGLGIVCVNKSGIQAFDFVTEYFGEIYPPWRWFEKQDVIKTYMKGRKGNKNSLPDFYNIMLEIHRKDPKGYDILFVDPINKGNYSSRLSHSCDPNCGTITTVTKGEYVIGMFALKDIKYGDELTFDYYSVTESEFEFRSAICLCGTERCRGHFLELANSKSFNTLQDKYHCFLARNAIIHQACSDAELNASDLEILDRFNIRASILEDSPPWLQKWIALTLKFIHFERENYVTEFLRVYNQKRKNKDADAPEIEFTKEQEQQYSVQSYVVQDNRVQNLVITVDKVKHNLKLSEESNPPFIPLTIEEILVELWGDSEMLKRLNSGSKVRPKEESSLKDDIHAVFREFLGYYHTDKKAFQLLNKFDINAYDDEFTMFTEVRRLFLQLSEALRSETSDHFNIQAFADVLYLYAFTFSYFRAFDYKGCQSEAVVVRKCDVHEPNKYEKIEHNTAELEAVSLHSENKKYSNQFIWGQLVGWFKQTVDKPQASLSEGRRGTLAYPSFTESFRTPSFPFKGRAKWLESIKMKPSNMWPTGDKWSYKNERKVYGTVSFDGIVYKEAVPDFLELVIDSIDKEASVKMAVFDQITEKVYKVMRKVPPKKEEDLQ
eukprot:TRINITY_DN2599_c0_g1_i2.p1 TRINITY_DN2599_c0_g1~~TRINITY_DN2599_c0_g1_i2.p1  ORF type:complete len:672 (+),score=154.96 TRINITY_DN2599_c0_g1_i2:1413-3428(+)